MSAADIRPTCPKCHGSGRIADAAPVGGLDEMLAAAEERGRRAGIEEAAALIPIGQGYGPDLKRQILALAPRDSGKEG